MADHSELVAEMHILEQMGTQERQKLAKKRRLQQLKRWSQREKELLSKEKHFNKRLANTLSEENNGANLRQYTTYSSSHRSKKKLAATAAANLMSAAADQQNLALNTNNNNNNNNSHANNNNNINLAPNGRVMFDAGVMLLEAAARTDYDEVKRLLELGVSPDSVNHDGLTALHQCCIDASEPMMRLLLDHGADVDARDTEQWTPLHAACTCGHLKLIEILMAHGADLLAVNGDGNMPFDICEHEPALDLIEAEMLKREITQEQIDLKRASTETQMLLDLQARLKSIISEQSSGVPTPASDEPHSASKNNLDGSSKMAAMDLNAANESGVTPLHVAAANNYISVVEFLLKSAVDANVCDSDKWRPLHGVACWGSEQHVRVAELLVEAGAELDAKTGNDETVFDLCDNPELLARLGQLRDELETRNANAAANDALKRTQSRTNSRIHSVRRTSVRDKNLISRREARQEALLRSEQQQQAQPQQNGVETQVEVSTNCPSDKTNGGQQATPGNRSLEAPPSQASESNGLAANEKPGDSAAPGHQTSSSPKDWPDAGSESPPPPLPKIKSQAPQPPRQARASSHAAVDVGSDVIPDRPQANGLQSADPSCRLQDGRMLAPVNFTLSNLKKQRSDLRMRVANGGAALVVVGGGHSSSSASALELAGPERPLSPAGSTYRKFCGEPSEAVGGASCDGGEQRGRRQCCSLI